MTVERMAQTNLYQLSQLVETHLGLSYPKPRWKDLRRAITQATPGLGFDDPHSCLQWLLASPWQEERVEALSEYLTIGETHFFRDRKLFDNLEQRILPDLTESRRHVGRQLRIWSAGCATGEEPYSIALLLKRIVLDLENWNITILATDVNKRFLKKAEQGLYSRWSFRSVPPWIQDNYFSIKGDDYQIFDNIKAMVKFAYLNLAKDTYPMYVNDTETMDLIFCRNVLMYFTEERQKQVLDNMSRCLVDGGWLIVSPAEAALVESPQFVPINLDGAMLFRKNRRSTPRTKLFQPTLENRATETELPVFVPQVAHLHPPESSTNSVAQSKSKQQPAIKPDNHPYIEGLDLYEGGHYSQAIDKLTQALKLNQLEESQVVSAMSLLARAYANQGMLVEALKWAEKTLATEKVNPIYHYLHASIFLELGHSQDAVVALKKALFLDPNLVVAHFALGNIARQRGDTTESDRHYKNALATLNGRRSDELMPASDGMTAGELRDVLLAMNMKEIRNAKS